MKYISLFSGIEAASVAWKDLDLEPVAFSEIDKFPSTVLQYHFPDVPNLGDITKVDWSEYKDKVDLIVGGSPCFPAGTLVTMISNGQKPIEDVVVGDVVKTHTDEYHKVLRTGNTINDTIILKDEFGNKLECTSEHPIYARRDLKKDRYEWIPAYDMVGKYWSHDNEWILVESISSGRKNVVVYNLEVEQDNSYVAERVKIHNCQSFSLAGNREGLKGESRLMFEYIRAVQEVLPKFFLWENVPGALSSDDGRAFQQLLSEMDELGYTIAWRILDAQFFGVPQRRRRVFVVGSLGNSSCAEVLFDQHSMRWDNPTSREQRERLTSATKTSTGRSYSMLTRCGKPGGGKGPLIQDDVSSTLSTANMQTIFQDKEDCITFNCLANSPEYYVQESESSACSTLLANDSAAVAYVNDSIENEEDIPSNALTPWDCQSKRVYPVDAEAPFLSSGSGGGSNTVTVCYGISGDVARGARLDKNGPWANEEVSFTLNTVDIHAVSYLPFDEGQITSPENGSNPEFGDPAGTLSTYCNRSTVVEKHDHEDFTASNGEDVVGALCAVDWKGPESQYVDEGKVVSYKSNSKYIVRRLTPTECERLQGFEDNWTNVPYNGKDEAPDSLRYKAIGNSMAVPVMRWIGERLVDTHKNYDGE